MSLTKIEIKIRRRKKYIEKKLIPQTGFFYKINKTMLWIEKIWNKK